MNYLQLCQNLSMEADLPGGRNIPAAVIGQTDELDRFVVWINDAYTDIQNRHGHSWRWKFREFALTTVASTKRYAFDDAALTDITGGQTGVPITAFDSWALNNRKDPPKIYLTSSGPGTQNRMLWTIWSWYRQVYELGVLGEGYPAHISIDPQDQIVLGQIPNDIYTVEGMYYEGVQNLEADDDTPTMPDKYHKLIVFRALEKYGWFESDQTVIDRAVKEGNRIMRQLERNQLKKMGKKGPMV